tara:strand:- start:492 stop:722 length:231 start_codon:yes stop_codon:yes gene_type:complete
MTKFILILYLCTSVSGTPKCNQEAIVGFEFMDYSTCVIQGYRHAHNNLIQNYTVEEVNMDKLAIRFECKEITTENT